MNACLVCSDEDHLVNVCGAQEPDSHVDFICRSCICDYIRGKVNASFLGTCPMLVCPCRHLDGESRLLSFSRWPSIVPTSVVERYKSLSASILAFLCAGCHSQRSIGVVAIDANQAAAAKVKLDAIAASPGALVNDLHRFEEGLLNVDKFYEVVSSSYLPSLLTAEDDRAWDVFRDLLAMIGDPERRNNLHLRYLRGRPRIMTPCCQREHCFNCRIKDFHHNKTCAEIRGQLDSSIVDCPSCGIYLTKGDGCNTVTCVCGRQFSWSQEKENTIRASHFADAFPESTSECCARVLCRQISTDTSRYLHAKAWQNKHRVLVNIALLSLWRNTYKACASQACISEPLQTMGEGWQEAASLWQARNFDEVSACVIDTATAKASLFNTMFPNDCDRPIAALRILGGFGGIRVRSPPPQDSFFRGNRLLVESARTWLEHRPENRRRCEAEAELLERRSALQFLFLYGKHTIASTPRPATQNAFEALDWNVRTSNQALTFSNFNATAKREGSISCYPAAFADIPRGIDRATMTMRVDACPKGSNWMTFGIAKVGFTTSSSDGVGRTLNSWGVCDDRGLNGTSCAHIAASGSIITSCRKILLNDLLCVSIDLTENSCVVAIRGERGDEFAHRFALPPAPDVEYCFACTFASDHVVTIVPSSVFGFDNLSISSSGPASSASQSGGASKASTSVRVHSNPPHPAPHMAHDSSVDPHPRPHQQGLSHEAGHAHPPLPLSPTCPTLDQLAADAEEDKCSASGLVTLKQAEAVELGGHAEEKDGGSSTPVSARWKSRSKDSSTLRPPPELNAEQSEMLANLRHRMRKVLIGNGDVDQSYYPAPFFAFNSSTPISFQSWQCQPSEAQGQSIPPAMRPKTMLSGEKEERATGSYQGQRSSSESKMGCNADRTDVTSSSDGYSDDDYWLREEPSLPEAYQASIRACSGIPPPFPPNSTSTSSTASTVERDVLLDDIAFCSLALENACFQRDPASTKSVKVTPPMNTAAAPPKAQCCSVPSSCNPRPSTKQSIGIDTAIDIHDNVSQTKPPSLSHSSDGSAPDSDAHRNAESCVKRLMPLLVKVGKKEPLLPSPMPLSRPGPHLCPCPMPCPTHSPSVDAASAMLQNTTWNTLFQAVHWARRQRDRLEASSLVDRAVTFAAEHGDAAPFISAAMLAAAMSGTGLPTWDSQPKTQCQPQSQRAPQLHSSSSLTPISSSFAPLASGQVQRNGDRGGSSSHSSFNSNSNSNSNSNLNLSSTSTTIAQESERCGGQNQSQSHVLQGPGQKQVQGLFHWSGALAYQRVFESDCTEWYEYNARLPEPLVPGLEKHCRCLPRHLAKQCPVPSSLLPPEQNI